jgi:alpha-glucosidase
MIGEACNAFGIDYERLVLEVDYQSKDRLRVHIYDADRAEYISASLIRKGGGCCACVRCPLADRRNPPAHCPVPEEVFETPGVDDGFDMTTSDLVFNHDPSPFAFWITRANSDAAPIFDTRPSRPCPTPFLRPATAVSSRRTRRRPC